LFEIWKSVAAVSGARMYSLIASAAMVTIVARWLGPAGQGTIGAANAWATLLATMGSLSLGQVAVHHATVRRHETWLPETMGTLGMFAMVVTVAAWVVGTLLYVGTDGRAFGAMPASALAVASLMVPFLVWELYGANLLTVTNRLNIYNSAQLIGRTVGVVLMAVCWFLRFGVIAALAVGVISQMIIACVGIRELFAIAGGGVRATVKEAKALLRSAARLHINTVTGYVYTSLGVLIVNRYCTPTETGWYQLCVSLVNVLLVVPLAAASVLTTEVVRVGPDAAWRLQRRVLVSVPLLMTGLAVAAAVCAPVAIPLVVGQKYIPAVPLFQWSLFGIVGLSLAAIMASQWIGRGYFWQLSASSIVVAAIHLTATLWLVRRFGMFGAVYANLITSGIAILGNGAFAVFCELRYRHAVGGVASLAVVR